VQEMDDVLYLADSAQDFEMKIESSLKPNQERIVKGIRIAQANSWENRAEKIWDEIRALDDKKRLL